MGERASISFHEAMDHIEGGAGWARPLSWRGTGRIVAEMPGGYRVVGPASRGLSDFEPGPVRQEIWEAVSPADLDAEGVTPGKVVHP